jgi:formate dehydrogenase iron-sulfur subunit
MAEEKAILVDTSKCIACKGCQIACKQWNELSAGKSEFFASNAETNEIEGYENPADLSYHTYTKIRFHLTTKDNGDPDWLFRKIQCMHCTEAQCLDKCPQKTIKRTDEGFVYIDRTNCVGCGTCVAVCPFGVPRLTEDKVVMENGEYYRSHKCWGCKDRILKEAGSDVVKVKNPIPACVKTCAPDALSYGDRDTILENAKTRKTKLEAKGKTVYIYGEDELGGLHYIYILLREPSFYGLKSDEELRAGSRRAYLRYLRDQGKLYANQFLKKVAV